jgi:hypothetical protein
MGAIVSQSAARAGPWPFHFDNSLLILPFSCQVARCQQEQCGADQIESHAG